MSDAKREYPDFTHFAAYTKRLRSCTLCLSEFRVVARFGSHSWLTCCPLRPPGDGNRLFRACGSDLSLRHVMSGSALATVLESASPRADFSGLPGSRLQRPVKLLTPVQI